MNDQPPQTSNQPPKLPPLGGGYLKAGQMKLRQDKDGKNLPVRCTISARNGGTRKVPAHGGFKEAVEIPLNMDGIQKILSLPVDAEDVQKLNVVFGPYENWTGRTVEVVESDVFDIIRISPVG